MKNIISIVTPSYNHGKYLAKCLESILFQEGNFFIDLIIVDGGSNDNSCEIIKHYESLLTDDSNILKIKGLSFYVNNAKIKLINRCLGISYRWVSERDKGHFDALNKGFKTSVGDIMAWLNSDDYYQPYAFQSFIDVFNQFDDISWLQGKTTSYDRYGRIIGLGSNKINLYDFIINRSGFIQQESTVWRRSLWEQAGAHITENYKFMIDGELWSRFFRYAKLWYCNFAVSGYRSHGENRAVNNIIEVKQEMELISDKLKKELTMSIEDKKVLAIKQRFIDLNIKKKKYIKESPLKTINIIFRKILVSKHNSYLNNLKNLNKYGYCNIEYNNDKDCYEKKVKKLNYGNFN